MATSDREAAPRILDVGQCGFDHGAISGYLADRFGARVERADTADEARRMLQSARYDLVLINRLLDVDGSPGPGPAPVAEGGSGRSRWQPPR